MLAAALLFSSAWAQDKPVAPISETELAVLQEELEQVVRGASSVDIRRACKSIIRKADALLEAADEAPNRFEVLAVMFDCQKRVLALEVTEENRGAIFVTCDKLVQAPDEYAELRLEADMLLSERDLALKQAETDERVKALEGILAEYRGTQAEWKSLMIGSLVAGRLQEFDVEKTIRDTMFERFAGDHNVIKFRRESNPGNWTDAVFSGTYLTASGSSLTFPCDLVGHQYVVCFWSESMPDLNSNFAVFKEMQELNPGRFRVFSFNLDEMPDAGKDILSKKKLDWTVLHLPGGRASSAFQAYAVREPYAMLVNGQGHALLRPLPSRPGTGESAGTGQGWDLPDIVQTLDDERYLAQLQYIFIGDYLVSGAGKVAPVPSGDKAEAAVPREVLQEIQSCFTLPPFRYRLSSVESLDNYRKAETLCAAAIKTYSQAANLWMVRNCRIMALIGMWNGTGEPTYLRDAVEESKTVLGMDLPSGADVAAHFCMAKAELRSGRDPEALVADMVEKTGGSRAPAKALAAAASLALEGNARTAYNEHLRRLLEIKGADIEPDLWSLYAFLQDRHHGYRNFWATPGGYGFDRPQKYKFRDTVGGLEQPQDRHRCIQFDLRQLDDVVIRVPQFAGGEMLGVVFVEPPADLLARSNLVVQVNGFGRCYTGKGVKAVVAFLSDDTNTVSSMIADLDSALQVGILPGGLGNPLVQQLGVLSADRLPNPLLFRPDGTLAWMISGLEYRTTGSGHGHAVSLAIGANIEKVRSDVAFELLEKCEFKNALDLFLSFVPADKHNDWWAADRMQGKALAYMGLKDFNAALTEIDAAIMRRKNDFKSGMCKCHGVAEMLLTKADVLDKLGRDREAKIERSRADKEHLPHSKLPPADARGGVPVGVYYEQLKQVRLGLEAGA